MAYYDINCEGLTFSEWVQAAGLYKPIGGSAYQSGASCAGYSTSTSYYQGYDKHDNKVDVHVNLSANGGRAVRKSRTQVLFPKAIRNAWRNGEDPTEYLTQAPRRWCNSPAPATAGDPND